MAMKDFTAAEYEQVTADHRLWCNAVLARTIQRYRAASHPDRHEDGQAFVSWVHENDSTYYLHQGLGRRPGHENEIEGANVALRTLDVDRALADFEPVQERLRAEAWRARGAVRAFQSAHGELVVRIKDLPEHKRNDPERALLEQSEAAAKDLVRAEEAVQKFALEPTPLTLLGRIRNIGGDLFGGLVLLAALVFGLVLFLAFGRIVFWIIGWVFR